MIGYGILNKTTTGQDTGMAATQATKEYTYMAFISYKRQDGAWAKWLQRQLQAYRLPAKLRQRREDLPKRCAPVFLDRTNLTPGILEEGLRSEVQSSRFIIVICSKNAVQNPEYLDAELQFFLERGDPARVIPFIVDDAPRPEVECFPPRLRQLCAERNVVGANVYDSGRRDALLKVVACMLGLKLEELESFDGRRRRRNRRILVAAAAAVSLCIGGLLYYLLPTSAYYADFAEVYGVPRGIGWLWPWEAKQTCGHYELVSAGGRVRELRYSNGQGYLMEQSDESRPVLARYTYDDAGALQTVTRCDEKGNEQATWRYVTPNIVDIFDISDPFTTRDVDRLNAQSQDARQDVVRYLIDYDENGYMTQQRYVSETRYNTVGRDENGIYGHRYQRDDRGRAVAQWYLTYNGTFGAATDEAGYAVTEVDGIAGMRYAYDDRGDRVRVSLRDRNDEEPADGVAWREFRYDDHHNLIEVSYHTASGALCLSSNRYAVRRFTRDEHGDIVAQQDLDETGAPTINSQGFSLLESKYDEKGRNVEDRLFDRSHAPCLSVDGCAVVRREYDDSGRLTKLSFYDEQDRLSTAAGGYAVGEAVYDENGNEIETSYFDANGTLVLSPAGFARMERTFNEQGKPVEQRCYDEGGALILRATLTYLQGTRTQKTILRYKEGRLISEATVQYSLYGTISDSTFTEFDANEAPLSKMLVGYDEKGNRRTVTDIQYDGNGQIKKRSVIENDENGNRRRYAGQSYEDGKLTEEFGAEYDENGVRSRMTSATFDEAQSKTKETIVEYRSGQAVRMTDEYYDESGRTTRKTVCDFDENKAIVGSSDALYFYDETGALHESGTSQYDGAGKLIRIVYASYYPNGAVAESKTLDYRVETLLKTIVIRYDEQGNVTFTEETQP